MKIKFLYNPNSDHARLVDDYAREFGFRYPDFTIQMLSTETRDGADLAELYDIVQYPAVMVVDNDSRVAKVWQGSQLPVMDEIAYYAMA